MYRRPIAAALALLPATTAQAATANIDVRGSDGKPLAGAVVLIDTPRAPPGPIRFTWGTAMGQRNIQFDPHVLIVPVGSTVSFPNYDKVRHHVYSFSRTKKFDLKLFGKDESRSIVFDRIGAVAVGCNIHDRMSGFILVVDTPYAMQTDANGHVRIDGVPPGAVTVRVWHPSIRGNDGMLAQAATVPAAGLSTTYTLRR